MLKEFQSEEEREERSNTTPEHQKKKKIEEETTGKQRREVMSKENIKQHNAESITMVVLDQLLGDMCKGRLHTEKVCKEKDYQLKSN